MAKRGRLLFKIYGAISLALMALGFAGLFSRTMEFRIPIVSTHIIPALHRHAVWGETLRGRAILLRGEDWFFLIIVGLVILLGIFTAVLNKLLQSATGK
ncbi:hypothetical protein [Desulfosarcina sp.]|uniref:hypothetical protein n=1 Tax=Desulfosarcina sp. TaxID=2027861 RepID=UPI0029B103D5|nr:hypothetical protein [Desulfosarcina sp.]MDX2453687.1 hypothetical protein [Desulfosarcina sp.]